MATNEKSKRKWRLSFLNKKSSKGINKDTPIENNDRSTTATNLPSAIEATDETCTKHVPKEATKPSKTSNWTMIKNLRKAIKAPDMEENLPGLAPVMTILLKNPQLLVRLLGNPTIQRLLNNPEAIRKVFYSINVCIVQLIHKIVNHGITHHSQVLTQLPVAEILKDPSSFDTKLKEIDVIINEMDKTGDSRSSSDGERDAPISVASFFEKVSLPLVRELRQNHKISTNLSEI